MNPTQSRSGEPRESAGGAGAETHADDLKLQAAILVPIIQRHGINRAHEIMLALQPILAVMQEIPIPIREDAMREFFSIVDYARQQSGFDKGTDT